MCGSRLGATVTGGTPGTRRRGVINIPLCNYTGRSLKIKNCVTPMTMRFPLSNTPLPGCLRDWDPPCIQSRGDKEGERAACWAGPFVLSQGGLAGKAEVWRPESQARALAPLLRS